MNVVDLSERRRARRAWHVLNHNREAFVRAVSSTAEPVDEWVDVLVNVALWCHVDQQPVGGLPLNPTGLFEYARARGMEFHDLDGRRVAERALEEEYARLAARVMAMLDDPDMDLSRAPTRQAPSS